MQVFTTKRRCLPVKLPPPPAKVALFRLTCNVGPCILAYNAFWVGAWPSKITLVNGYGGVATTIPSHIQASRSEVCAVLRGLPQLRTVRLYLKENELGPTGALALAGLKDGGECPKTTHCLITAFFPIATYLHDWAMNISVNVDFE